MSSRGYFRSISSGSDSSSRSYGSTGSGNGLPERKSTYRVVVMGDACVGKTSLVTRVIDNSFPDKYIPTVEKMYRASFVKNGESLAFDILDTSGSYEFPAMQQLNIDNGDVFVLVYRVDSEATFEGVRRLRQIIQDRRGDDVPIVVVGNMADLQPSQRNVKSELAEPIVCIDWDNGYVETSAKNNVNVMKVFQEVLVQAKVDYDLSADVPTRRKTLPNFRLPRKLSLGNMPNFRLPRKLSLGNMKRSKREGCTIS